MVILPAIDLKGGKCVRLRQGRADDVTVYGDDPAAQAKDWAALGGRELHVVDLDGAFAGTPRHAEVIARIIRAFGGPVEVGGGLRTPEALAAVIEAGRALCCWMFGLLALVMHSLPRFRFDGIIITSVFSFSQYRDLSGIFQNTF